MTENSFYIPVGNGTEVSLIKWLQNADIAVHETMAKKEDRVLVEVPFNSHLKRSITAIAHPELQDIVRIYIKGAPEVVIANCKNHYSSEDAHTEEGVSYKRAVKTPLSEQDKSRMLDTEMRKMLEEPRRAGAFSGTGESLHSMRAMAFSYCDMSQRQFDSLL